MGVVLLSNFHGKVAEARLKYFKSEIGTDRKTTGVIGSFRGDHFVENLQSVGKSTRSGVRSWF
jgi:hypothetical protein